MAFGVTIDCDSLAQRLIYQVWAYPQEKIYMITDRDAYVSGDTVRFRAFLVNASSHQQSKNGSQFIYVELTTPFGETIKRIKVKQNDGAFAGIIPIDEETPEGADTLTAYTQFMQNPGSDFFFQKSLPILSNLSQKYTLTADFEDLKMTMTLKDKFSKKPVR
ncbi:MAG: MG2 domain-containing protein, partial [Muribaculaceae bacterium]|nr:MG2 domain-containing protein [Muribaculaceae bacterium]